MPLPLAISCSSKSRLVLTFLVLSFWYLLPGWSRTYSRTAVKQLCVCTKLGKLFQVLTIQAEKENFRVNGQVNISTPVQVCPSPVKPSKQTHLNDPGLLVQTLLGEHSSRWARTGLHSSMSVYNVTNAAAFYRVRQNSKTLYGGFN